MTLSFARRRAIRPAGARRNTYSSQRDGARDVTARSAVVRWHALDALEPRVLFAGDFPITQVLTGAEPVGALTFNPTYEAVTNQTGQIVVRGILSGPGVNVDNQLAQATGTSGSVSLVLRQGDVIPGTNAAIYNDFNFPERLIITDSGVIGYSDFVSNGSEFGYGVWTGDASSLTLRTGSVNTGGAGAISAAGNVAYITSTFPSKVFINDSQILIQDQTINVNGGEYTAYGFIGPISVINASDQFPLEVSLRRTDNQEIVHGVLVVGSGGIERGVTEDELVDAFGGGTVTSMFPVDINAAGQVLIQARFFGDVTTANDEALFLWDGGSLTLVAREGDMIPGTSLPQFPGSTTGRLRFALSGSGQVLFSTNINTFPDIPDFLATWSGGEWNVIVENNTHAPGTPAGVDFISLAGAAINDRGTVVFSGQLGGSLLGKTGLWAYVDSALHNVALSTDSVDTPSGSMLLDLRSPYGPIDALTLGTGENGKRTPLTDNDRVVFSTATHGVFIADLGGPPQPGAVHGLVWNDYGGDGVINLEPGVANVEVRLENTSGNIVAGPILTDADGIYRFDSVQPGDYRVRVISPSGATFSPLGPDNEIGVSGLSPVLTVGDGGDIEADAGLILPGPTATLVTGILASPVDMNGNVDLTVYAGGITPISLVVKYSDSDGVDESSLAATSLSIFRFGSLLPVAVADFVEVLNGNGIDDQEEGVRYTFSSPGAFWRDTDLGDYTILTTTPTAKDHNGKPGEVGELVGLFSLIDGTAPAITQTNISTELISPMTPTEDRDQVAVDILLNEAFNIDSASVVNGSLAVRRVGTTQTTPLTLGTFSSEASEAIFMYPAPSGEFGVDDSGRFEVVTGAAAIKDDAGNAFPPGQVLGTFSIDFKPPTAAVTFASDPTAGASFYDFVVTWRDDETKVRGLSLVDGSIQVIAPDNSVFTAERFTPPNVVDQQEYQLTYRLAAPGGAWDAADAGLYRVQIANDQVTDIAGNQVTSGTDVGSFEFDAPPTTETASNEGRKTTKVSLADQVAEFVQSGVSLGIELKIEHELEKIFGKNDLLISGASEIVKLVIDPQNPLATLKLIRRLQKGVTPLLSSVPIGAIEALGHMKEVVAPGFDLVTDAFFPGLDKLTLGNVRDDHTITIGAPDAFGKPYVDITLDRVANTDIISDTPIGTLTVTEWIDDDGDPDVISAPWIGKIIVKGNKKEGIAGDFMASLDLSGEGAPKGVVLGSATIAGDLVDADWSTGGGDVGSITVKGSVSSFGLGADGAIKGLKFGDVDTTGIVAGGNIKSVQAVRWLDGAITAGSVGSIKITGDKKLGIPGDMSMNLLVQTVNSDKQLLGAVSVAGSIIGGGWNIDGPAKSVTVGGAVAADFAASVAGVLGAFAAKGEFAGTLVAFDVSKFSAAALEQARISLGVSAGSNGVIGDTDDPFVFNSFLGSLKIAGPVNGTLITVGLRAIDQVFFNGDDEVAGGGIFSITIGGEMSSDSLFAASFFPRTASINKVKVDPLFDARFVTLAVENQ